MAPLEGRTADESTALFRELLAIMVTPSSWYSGIESLVVLYGIIVLRYFIVAGFFAFLLRCWRRSLAVPRVEGDGHDSGRSPQEGIGRDIGLSVGSAAIFALVGVVLMQAVQHGATRMYGELMGYGWWYLPVSYGLVLLLQDTVFYFTHRLFHQPQWYGYAHRSHHQSRPPTPWTSFAFDPPEAILQAVFLAVVVLAIPLHPLTLSAVLITMTVWAVINHLGLEDLKLAWCPRWLAWSLIGPSHHSMHHACPRVHFGLYFTFWDRALETQILDLPECSSSRKSR
jgi:sterol desaturase/sphingolipid hydroxylase (fatty acid hydroxylase superfamily)